jgi:hypothetical protein
MIYLGEKPIFQTFLSQKRSFIFDLPLTYRLCFKSDLTHVMSTLHATVSLLYLFQWVDAVYHGFDRAVLQVRINVLYDLLHHHRFLGKSLGA